MKKFFFEDYRFSEELDFILNATELTNEQLFEWFHLVFEYIREEANIPLELTDDNEHEDGGINFYIKMQTFIPSKEELSKATRLPVKLNS